MFESKEALRVEIAKLGRLRADMDVAMMEIRANLEVEGVDIDSIELTRGEWDDLNFALENARREELVSLADWRKS